MEDQNETAKEREIVSRLDREKVAADSVGQGQVVGQAIRYDNVLRQGQVRFEVAVPNKQPIVVLLPHDIDSDEWALVRKLINNYVAGKR